MWQQYTCTVHVTQQKSTEWPQLEQAAALAQWSANQVHLFISPFFSSCVDGGKESNVLVESHISLSALSLLTSRGLGSFRVTISRTARARGSHWLQMAKTWARGSPILESLTDTFSLREEVILSIFSLFLHEVYTRWWIEWEHDTWWYRLAQSQITFDHRWQLRELYSCKWTEHSVTVTYSDTQNTVACSSTCKTLSNNRFHAHENLPDTQSNVNKIRNSHRT